MPFHQLQDGAEQTFELKVNFANSVNAGGTLTSTPSREAAAKLTRQQINLALASLQPRVEICISAGCPSAENMHLAVNFPSTPNEFLA